MLSEGVTVSPQLYRYFWLQLICLVVSIITGLLMTAAGYTDGLIRQMVFMIIQAIPLGYLMIAAIPVIRNSTANRTED